MNRKTDIYEQNNFILSLYVLCSEVHWFKENHGTEWISSKVRYKNGVIQLPLISYDKVLVDPNNRM